MKHAVFSVLAILISISSFAQPDTLWTRDVEFTCIDVVPAGGFIAAGYDTLYRLDEHGNLLWTQLLGGGRGVSVVAAASGGYIIATEGGSTGHIIKCNAIGDVEWEYSVGLTGYAHMTDAAELPNEEIVFLHGPGYIDARLYRLSASGDLIESRPIYFSGGRLKVISDGLLIPGSRTDYYNVTYHYRLKKIPFGEASEFAFRFDSHFSYCLDVVELSNGFLLAGGFYPDGPAVVIHGPDGGIVRQVHPWPYPVLRVAETADNRAIIVSVNSLFSEYDISKVDGSLNIEWAIEGIAERVMDFGLANDGGLLLATETDNEYQLVKFEPEAAVSVLADAQTAPPETSIINFIATVDNILLDNTVLDVWSVLYPPVGDPIVSETSAPVTLVHGVTLVHEDSLIVLAEYPAGEYMCRVHVGDYEHDITMGANTFEFVKEGIVTEVDDHTGDVLLPEAFTLSAYPNPFNASTTISVELPTSTNLRLAVYNVSGREVAVLNDGQAAAGMHQFTFDAGSLASGVYFVRAVTPDQTKHQKVLLVR
jgi:Secretion system C-terminal sorting domain